MGLINHIHLLDHIHYRIEHKCTGNPESFASRLGISQSKLYRVLAELRDSGIEITYDSQRSTYLYNGSVKIDNVMKVISNNGNGNYY